MNFDDPDYESFNINLKIKEENDLTTKLENLRKKFDETFQNELKLRQTQLDTIENRLLKARKTLHLLRYAIVTSYYKSQEFEVNKSQDEKFTDNQNRIHPAVKRLLGDNLESIQNVNSRRKKIKLEKCEENEKDKETAVKQENNVVYPEEPEKQDNKPDVVDGIRNRKQIKRRIIVGNISKWMPAECKSDNTTHKWMVYVRTPKDCEDISTLVEKVLFYLHPSYKPNHIIELTNTPFHLSRRGWGEFPLRVRIFFKCQLNKPIDIIHHLKLDKTYTGRQTLGNETVVDLLLYDNDCDFGDSVDTQIKEENDQTNQLETEEIVATISEENSSNNSLLKNIIYLEHSYSSNSGIKREASDRHSPINVTELDSSSPEKSFKGDGDSVCNIGYSSEYPDFMQEDLMKKEEIYTDVFETTAENVDFFQ